MMDIFQKMKIMAQKDSNEFLESGIKKGKKVIGYFCSYVPEEIIHAAGFVPYRMRAVASGGTSKGDVYFSSINCTFVRHCFHKALRGDFHFLDGVIFMNGCDHCRRMYDNWRHADVKPDFRYMFVAPHVVNKTAHKRFIDEIIKFKQELGERYDVRITDEALRESIRLYNRKRSLLAELYDSRKQGIVPIRGSELLNILLAVTMMPVEDSITLLETVKNETRGRRASSENDVRIFLAAGCVEEGEHLELIEKCGGAIVADNICYGARYMDSLVDLTADPVQGIAARYLDHVSCPRMIDDFRRRMDFLNKAIKEYSVDAIIAEKLKFCDLWGGEIYIIRKESKKQGFPVLALERELYGAGEGQIRTRIQAFFEQIRNRGGIDPEMVKTAGCDYTVK